MSVTHEAPAEAREVPSWPSCECGEPVRQMRPTKGMIGVHPNPDGLCLRCHVRAKDAARRPPRPPAPKLRRIDDLEDVQEVSLRDERPPVRLRLLLERDRRLYSLPFDEVFDEDVALAVRDLHPTEAMAWRNALVSCREAWASAYNRTPSPLAAFSVDVLLGGGGETPVERAELVA